jgi:hypothetical protein
MDSVPGTDIYEFHIYEDSAAFRKAVNVRGPLETFERGIVAPDGTFIAKHGRSSAIPKLPGSVHNAIRGVVSEEARRRGWLGDKGTVNIKGRNLTDQIRIGMQRAGSFRYLSVLGRTLGIVGVGTTIFHPSIEQACELDPSFEGC